MGILNPGGSTNEIGSVDKLNSKHTKILDSKPEYYQKLKTNLENNQPMKLGD